MKSDYDIALFIWIGVGLLSMAVLFFQQAPYGRHLKPKGWGPLISSRLGWFLMEIPALTVFPLTFLLLFDEFQVIHMAAFLLWGLHYIHRALIFPFRMRTTGKKIPLSVPLMGIFFNSVNGFFLGKYLADFSIYSPDYFDHWIPWMGIVLFLAGYAINLDSDTRLINLRKPGETGYKIPQGGFFKWLSAPNYFGEILEWTGFALLLWNFPAVGFLVWTVANLLPRALSNHKWYREKFENYPRQRKAIFPFVL